MQERPQNLNEVGHDPEATLVTPRFDAEEARRAEPVVPLAETHAPYANVPPRRGPRRSWPTALFAVVLLAAVATGGVVATKVMRRSYTNTPAQTEAATVPAEAAPASAQTADVPRPEELPSAAQAPREEARAKQPSRTRGVRAAEGAMVAAPDKILRGDDDEDSDDRDDGRRGRGRDKRRERAEEEAEKEIRKAVKRAKDKAPRLVDVLTGP